MGIAATKVPAPAAPPLRQATPLVRRPAMVASPPQKLLQRSCACGAQAGFSGRCESCDRTALRPQQGAAPVHMPLASAPAPAIATQARLPSGDARMVAPLAHNLGQLRVHPAGPTPSVRPPLQTQLRVSMPGDAAEQEAQEIGAAVARMADPAPLRETPVAQVSRAVVQRRATASEYDAPEDVADELQRRGGGAPLPDGVRGFMEARFGADFSNVRVHTDAGAASLNARLSARAFTTGRDVYFAHGEFRPETTTGRELIAHELTHTIQQSAVPLQPATPRPVTAAPVRVAMRAPASLQRAALGNAIDWLADKANAIPGFRMLTIVLGVNPISMAPVDRSAANILRAIVEFIPGGFLIVTALNNSGVFEKAGAWVSDQFSRLGLAGTAIKQAIDSFLASLKLRDVFHPGDVWDRAKRIFTEPIDRLVSFAKGLLDGILKLLKEAILKPLAQLASKTRGWDLLIAVLGKNPITGEAVPRTAETLIGGFLKLIGQDEVWENMKKANAIPRAWTWFRGAMAALTAFVSAIPERFVAALKTLTIEDVVTVAGAFLKVGLVFGSFLATFIAWAGAALWDLAQIIIESVSPGALPYIKKTGTALKDVLLHPLRFAGNLVKAATLGFRNFAEHFGAHLKAGLIDWLTASLPGVYVPKAFELGEIVKFVLSVLGISWANVRAKLVKAVGETAVKAMETGFDIVVTLVRVGPAAAWDKIKEQLTTLKDTVIGGITDVVETLVQKAILRLLSMFVPGAGFVAGILAIYDTVMVFVNKLAQIATVAKAFVGSIVAIAAGEIGGAATRVESTLTGLLSLVINFLAGFAGLGKVADKVMGVIKKVQTVIDKALDKLVDWIVTAARKLGRFVAQAGVPTDPNERLRLAAAASLLAVRGLPRPFTGPILRNTLEFLKVRYGLSELQPFQQAEQWWARATINPVYNWQLPPDPQCVRIRDEIHKLVFQTKAETGTRGLAERMMDQIYGQNGPGTPSWVGHDTAITQIKAQIEKLMTDYIKRNCGGPNGHSPISPAAKNWINRQNPTPSEWKGPPPP